jgi:putative addiction module killer protein
MVAYKRPWDVAQIEILLYRRGRSTPFSEWLASLRDVRAVGIVRARLNRIRLGNFGDCKPVGGGVEELRIDFGPGYRIYYGRDGSLVVVLLCGGDKRTQARDILTAQRCWKEYLDAKTSG